MASVPVRWCISKELHESINEENIDKPFILFVVIDEQGYETRSRTLAPLSQGMTFVRFTKAGIHKLKAFILHSDDVVRGGYKALRNNLVKDAYHGREYNKWTPTISYSMSTDLWGATSPDFRINSSIPILTNGESHTIVEIPKEAFGKPYPEWLSNAMNIWYTNAPVDNCDQRKRLINLVTWKAPLLAVIGVVWYMLQFIYVTFLYSLGYTKMKWKHFKHLPHKSDLKALMDNHRDRYYKFDFGTNVFIYKSKDRDPMMAGDEPVNTKVSKIFWLGLVPFYWMVIGLMSIIVGTANKMNLYDSLSIFSSIGVTIGITIPLVVYVLLSYVIPYLKYFIAKMHYHVSNKETKPNILWYIPLGIFMGIGGLITIVFTPFIFVGNRLWTWINKEPEYDHDMENIMCYNVAEDATASLDEMPLHMRTKKLKFLKMKQAICKPLG